LASDSCFALNSAHLISQILEHWQIEDGLQHNYVTAIAHGRRLLVIGIQEGLARFDGVRFSPAAVDPALTWIVVGSVIMVFSSISAGPNSSSRRGKPAGAHRHG